MSERKQSVTQASNLMELTDKLKTYRKQNALLGVNAAVVAVLTLLSWGRGAAAESIQPVPEKICL